MALVDGDSCFENFDLIQLRRRVLHLIDKCFPNGTPKRIQMENMQTSYWVNPCLFLAKHSTLLPCPSIQVLIGLRLIHNDGPFSGKLFVYQWSHFHNQMDSPKQLSNSPGRTQCPLHRYLPGPYVFRITATLLLWLHRARSLADYATILRWQRFPVPCMDRVYNCGQNAVFMSRSFEIIQCGGLLKVAA